MVYSLTVLKPRNISGAQVLQFRPDHSDWIIWTSDEGCSSDGGAQYYAEAYFSQDNNRSSPSWRKTSTTVRGWPPKFAFVLSRHYPYVLNQELERSVRVMLKQEQERSHYGKD